MKKVTTKNTGNGNDQDNPAVTAPKIDKLAGVIDLKDEQVFGMAFSNILGWVEDHVPDVKRLGGSARYPLAVAITYPGSDGCINPNGPTLRLEISGPKSALRQARFEYNPSYMTEAGEMYLDTMFMEVFAGLSFYETLAHARFTRIDVCRDVLQRSPEDMLVYGKWKKTSQSFFGKAGKLQTINLGQSSGNQLIVYDKAAQLQGDGAEFQRTRVEARCKIKTTALGLAGLSNPFQNLVIYSVKCKKPPSGQDHWKAFVDSCRFRGVSNALKQQTQKMQKLIKKVLKQQPVTWWDMTDEEWAYFWTEGLENAGLTAIPNDPPPLTWNAGVGQAA